MLTVYRHIVEVGEFGEFQAPSYDDTSYLLSTSAYWVHGRGWGELENL